MGNTPDQTGANDGILDELRAKLATGPAEVRIEAALELAKSGAFDGIDVLLASLRDSYWFVRSAAAYALGRIGVPHALPTLVEVAKSDPQTDTRNTAIYALEGIGRIACIPHLIDCLNDSDPARRSDARTALVRIVGEDVLEALTDDMDFYNPETGEVGKDPDEIGRVRAWFQSASDQFRPDKVYYRGVLAHPEVFIRRSRPTQTLPSAILSKLEDWTGVSFGAQAPENVLRSWESWLREHGAEYEHGERYFYGRLIH